MGPLWCLALVKLGLVRGKYIPAGLHAAEASYVSCVSLRGIWKISREPLVADRHLLSVFLARGILEIVCSSSAPCTWQALVRCWSCLNVSSRRRGQFHAFFA